MSERYALATLKVEERIRLILDTFLRDRLRVFNGQVPKDFTLRAPFEVRVGGASVPLQSTVDQYPVCLITGINNTTSYDDVTVARDIKRTYQVVVVDSCDALDIQHASEQAALLCNMIAELLEEKLPVSPALGGIGATGGFRGRRMAPGHGGGVSHGPGIEGPVGIDREPFIENTVIGGEPCVYRVDSLTDAGTSVQPWQVGGGEYIAAAYRQLEVSFRVPHVYAPAYFDGTLSSRNVPSNYSFEDMAFEVGKVKADSSVVFEAEAGIPFEIVDVRLNPDDTFWEIDVGALGFDIGRSVFKVFSQGRFEVVGKGLVASSGIITLDASDIEAGDVLVIQVKDSPDGTGVSLTFSLRVVVS